MKGRQVYEFTRYAVRLDDDTWIGGKRFSYARGTEDASSSFGAMRLFSRKQDAERSMRLNGGLTVEPVVCRVEFEA